MFEWVLNTPLQLLCDFSTVTMISNQFFSKKKLLEPPQANHNAQHLLRGRGGRRFFCWSYCSQSFKQFLKYPLGVCSIISGSQWACGLKTTLNCLHNDQLMVSMLYVHSFQIVYTPPSPLVCLEKKIRNSVASVLWNFTKIRDKCQSTSLDIIR